MKPGFHPRLLNGYFEDPCLYIRIPWERQAILFDLGDLTRLNPTEIFRVGHVFVTHTHIDHFIGFDVILRAILRRDAPLHIYGPSNITACVEGKLRGYAWNLIKEYPTVIHVFAYNGRTLFHSVFRAENSFRKEPVGRVDSGGVLLRTPMFSVTAAKLDHDIPCLAFAAEEEFPINLDKDLLQKKGLAVGPWLTEFKKIIREGHSMEGVLQIGGKTYSAGMLMDIARITKGHKISYATDIGMGRKNISLLTSLVKGSDIFFCEAYFLEKDRERALERHHLTARTCGAIAKKAGVRKL